MRYGSEAAWDVLLLCAVRDRGEIVTRISPGRKEGPLLRRGHVFDALNSRQLHTATAMLRCEEHHIEPKNGPRACHIAYAVLYHHCSKHIPSIDVSRRVAVWGACCRVPWCRSISVPYTLTIF